MAQNKKVTARESEQHERYQTLVNARMPRSKTISQCILAFIIGGLICCVGQLVGDLGTMAFKLSEESRAAFTSIIMIFLGAFFTGIGVYDKLGSVAGAGSVVPITGFANSIVAPAMEHRREGLVMGVGAELFSIAGPVLVYGITSSVIVGLIAWLLTLC